jgi:hypothetical protein
MPHGNKKSRTSAKKKGSTSRVERAVAAPPSFPHEPFAAPPSFQPLQRNLDGDDDTSGNLPPQHSLLEHSKNSLYARYKRGTQRFKDALESKVPSIIFQSGHVKALADAAEYFVEHNLKVEPQLLRDLKVSILVRKRFADDRVGGGDEGHAYMIQVLEYCWSILAPRYHREARVTVAEAEGKTDEISFRNRFDKLSTDSDDDTDFDDNEDDLPSSPLPRPEETVPTRLSLQELINGTDRMDTILFLFSIDELMSSVSLQYSKLKEASASIQNKGYPPSVIIEQIMEASVATNLAIQEVASLEQIFILDHPHLNTVYRVLANLNFSELIQTLTNVVFKKSPIAAQFSEKHAVEFLGDAMECAFRNPSDPSNKQGTLVGEFLELWQFSDDVTQSSIIQVDSLFSNDMSIVDIFKAVDALTKAEVPLYQERDCGFQNLLRQNKVKSHTWLGKHTYIGGNRSITHTIRLLQPLSNLIVLRQGRLAASKGWFGPEWRDHMTRVHRTQVDMDSLLMEDIMPSLISMCYEGMLSSNLPFQEELMMVFCQVKLFIANPEQTVSWSLAFAIHSILISVFEVQGSNHFTFLVETSRTAFKGYLGQLDWTVNIPLTLIPRRPPIWGHNLKTLLSLQHLDRPAIKATERQKLRTAWNPLCAGTILSYVAYFGNLEGGMTLVDSVAQLRVTLHLFNALLQAKAIRPGQVDLLDWLFDTFKGTKTIWEGQLPTRGHYVTRWWIAFGMKANLAAQMQNNSSVRYNGRISDPNRKMTPIALECLSKSFRRICRRDVSGLVDNYHSASIRPAKGHKFTAVYKHAVRVNDTLDAMTEDGRLLATNFVSLSYYLNQFYISLLNVWGFMPLVEKFVSEASPETKQGRRTDFRSVGPNSWEASDENMKYQAMSHVFSTLILQPLDAGDELVASRCAEFMETFFNKIPPQRVMWFTPVTEE